MNTTYTDTQLKQALAKMLPERIHTRSSGELYYGTLTRPVTRDGDLFPVLDTELLHLCWLVEETLREQKTDGLENYICMLVEVCRMTRSKQSINTDYFDVAHATWQQRVIALCKVKGVEI